MKKLALAQYQLTEFQEIYSDFISFSTDTFCVPRPQVSFSCQVSLSPPILVSSILSEFLPFLAFPDLDYFEYYSFFFCYVSFSVAVYQITTNFAAENNTHLLPPSFCWSESRCGVAGLSAWSHKAKSKVLLGCIFIWNLGPSSQLTYLAEFVFL